MMWCAIKPSFLRMMVCICYQFVPEAHAKFVDSSKSGPDRFSPAGRAYQEELL
jgi:hypothetical protein